MRKPWLLLPLLTLVTLPAFADGGPEQAAVAGQAAPAQVHLKRQLRARGAEIVQLQRQLTEQESHSRQASDRLDEQDREIARLQRQLEALAGQRQKGKTGR
jgi:septal ring factor EnvC (AmiA/AmiB activator)